MKSFDNVEAAPQSRENAEPSERTQPAPLIAALVTLLMVLIGAGYVLLSDPFGPAALGDRRTLADLSAAKTQAGHPGLTSSEDGKALFAANCAACHQTTGKGLPGVFPPLDGSEWVGGDSRTVVAILLNGISGEIEVNGQSFKGVMPSFKQLTDDQVAALASFIRSQWSNSAGAVTTEEVSAVRQVIVRDTPFSGGAEIKALTAKK